MQARHPMFIIVRVLLQGFMHELTSPETAPARGTYAKPKAYSFTNHSCRWRELYFVRCSGFNGSLPCYDTVHGGMRPVSLQHCMSQRLNNGSDSPLYLSHL